MSACSTIDKGQRDDVGQDGLMRGGVVWLKSNPFAASQSEHCKEETKDQATAKRRRRSDWPVPAPSQASVRLPTIGGRGGKARA